MVKVHSENEVKEYFNQVSNEDKGVHLLLWELKLVIEAIDETIKPKCYLI
jgi:hypothetical protein